MYNKKLSIIISLVLSFVLAFNSTVHANNSRSPDNDKSEFTKEQMLEFAHSISGTDYKQNPYLEKYISELKLFLDEKETITKEAFEDFQNKSESYNLVISKQLELSSTLNEEYNKLFSESNTKQLERVDQLAKEYYEYYQEFGKFPFVEREKGSIVTIQANFVSILSSIGIRYSESSLATRLVTLGGISALDGPLPVLDFIALVTGVCLISIYAYHYVNTPTVKANLPVNIGNVEGAQFKDKVITTLTITGIVENAKKNNIQHFAATRYDSGAGGIIISEALQEYVAIQRARLHMDTFSVGSTLAQTVANKAGESVAKHETAHDVDTKPNNLPHWHPRYRSGTPYGSHCFYPKGVS